LYLSQLAIESIERHHELALKVMAVAILPLAPLTDNSGVVTSISLLSQAAVVRGEESKYLEVATFMIYGV